MAKTGFFITLDEDDNTAVARKEVPAGTVIPELGLTVLSDIPAGHKIAVREILKDEPVRKYGIIIGYATRDCAPGTHMHNETIHFDAKASREAPPEFCADYRPVEILPPKERRTFMGYVRPDGRVATRNYIAVAVASNCAATVARKIAAHFTPEVLSAYPNVDGVVPLITSIGCGMEKGGSMPMTYLRRVISGHVRNPNMAGAVIAAIGCENNDINDMFDEMGLQEGPMLKKLVIQQMGAPAAVRTGIEMVTGMLEEANKVSRSEVSAEHLTVALECGGSDSFSSVSANPALGRAMDILVKNGGTACIAEMTELFSTEKVLVRRAKSPEVGQKLLDRMQWWLEYSKGQDLQINGKVTPGNNRGGLTNILEKALGSVRKGGSTPVNAIIDYASPITEKGFVIMDTPSYDPVAATAQFAGGCTMCVFTSGRGSCYGPRYFPTVKVSSNSDLVRRMPEDIDVNAGRVIDGDATVDEVGQEIFERLLRAASGEKTCSEKFGMGDDEFVPWYLGGTS